MSLFSNKTPAQEIKPSLPASSGSVFSTEAAVYWTIDITKKANDVYKNPEFLKRVGEVYKYDYTVDSPETVKKQLSNSVAVIIALYTTKNPWSSAIATTFNNDRERIYLNTRKHPRPVPEMINTLFHEGLGHLNGYGHGDNYSAGKENSVPYKIGEIAEKLAVEMGYV